MFRLLAAVAALFLVTACGAGTTDSGGGGVGDNGAVVRLALGVDASYAPLYLAKERGLFEKAGLNVELMQVEGGPAAAEAVIAGTAQMSVNADSSVLPLMASNDNLRALGVQQSSDRYLKVVMRKGIDSPEQIKTMASIQGIGLYATHSYLEHHDIDPESIKIHKSSPPEIPQMLTRGSIDAYILHEPWATRGAEAGGHIVARIGDFGVSYMQWLLADKRWLDENTETAGKIFKVVAEANKIVTDDPKAGAEATEKQVKLPAEQTEKLLPEISFVARGFTDDDFTNAKKVLDFLEGQKLIKSQPDLQTMLLKGWYEKHVTSG